MYTLEDYEAIGMSPKEIRNMKLKLEMYQSLTISQDDIDEFYKFKEGNMSVDDIQSEIKSLKYKIAEFEQEKMIRDRITSYPVAIPRYLYSTMPIGIPVCLYMTEHSGNTK